MAYNVKVPCASPLTAGAQSVASTGVKQEFVMSGALNVRRVLLSVSTVLGAGAVTVSVTKRPIPGSSSGETVLTTLTIPALAAAGAKYYKDISDSVGVLAGESLAFNVTAAAASGAGYFVFEGEEDPETAANQSSMIASA